MPWRTCGGFLSSFSPAQQVWSDLEHLGAFGSIWEHLEHLAFLVSIWTFRPIFYLGGCFVTIFFVVVLIGVLGVTYIEKNSQLEELSIWVVLEKWELICERGTRSGCTLGLDLP